MNVFIHIEGQTPCAGLVMLSKSARVLLIKRCPDPEDPYAGQWDIPGGHASSFDGSILETALRETCEEVGVAKWSLWPQIPVIQALDINPVYSTFILRSVAEFKPKLSDEHTEYRWQPLTDLGLPMHPNLRRLLQSLCN